MAATIRVYRDGASPESAIEVRGITVGEAIRTAATRRLGLRVSRTKLVEHISSRHRLIEWAGVRLHVLEESRSGSSGAGPTHEARRVAGLLRLDVYLSPAAARALQALVLRLGSKRAAVEYALVGATNQ